MTSKVEYNFSEAHFDMISCFFNFWSCPYGLAMWKSHMAEQYGRAWQPRPRPLDAMEDLIFFSGTFLGKTSLKNRINAKKNRLKILYPET